MILSCSACSNRFLVDPALLGPEGRMVRCAKCGHQWKQTPSEDVDEDAATDSLEDAAGVSMLLRIFRRQHGL